MIFYFVAHNYAGGVASEERVYSTTLTSPTFNSLDVADVTPFSLTIGVDVEIEPKRQLLYAFSKDDGNTWTPYQESSSYQWTGLTEETTYDFAIRARALHESLYAQDSYITMSYRHTTPADQAKVYVKAGDGATNHPAIDGYQPIGGITASSADQMIVLREEYPFADTTAEITMKWNDINTVQNIGSNCGGYFGVANGYYTFMGRQTQRQAIVDEVVTVRLVSTFSHADSPEMSGGSAYYDVSCYINGEWVAGGEGRSTPAVPMYFYFYLFGCYNLPGFYSYYLPSEVF